MLDWIVSLGHWNWFVLAVVLLAIEVLAPGTFIMWLGIAALLVGLVSLAVPWSWQAQVIAFGVLAVLSIPAWRYFAVRVEKPTNQPHLNRRAEGYVGRVLTLETPIVNGGGTVRIDDTVWRVRGPDSPVGAHVRVRGVDGNELTVEAA